ncbi:MAG: ATP-binding protein [Sideroxydans sp.]|nr:ATP-binding protein [Sideroxydans sp.]
MILKSFRLRLALLSALLSGVALMGFGAFAWWVVYDIKVKQVEIDVISNAERESRRMMPPEVWRDFGEVVLPRLMNSREPRQLLFLVEDASGEVIYRSPHWPTHIDPLKFSWPLQLLKAGEMNEQGFMPPPPDGMRLGRPPLRPDDIHFDRPPHPQDFLPYGPPDGGRSMELRSGQLPRPRSVLQTLKVGDAEWKIGLATSQYSRVAIAVDLEAVDLDMGAISNGFMFAVPFALAFIGLGAWFVSARALDPVRRLNRSIHRVTAQGLDHRITLGGEDKEFAELIRGFNAMLERLEKSFKQASRFSADAAHELRTPLTILQGQIERAMTQVEAGSSMQTTLVTILDEVRRLSSISRKLLLLSQADAGRLRLQRASVDLSAELGGLVEDAKMMKPELAISSEIEPRIFVNADDDLLRQVLVNLISNALKYNIDEGWVKVAANHSADTISVVISNASNGIPMEARDKLFERFYRVDSAHNRKVDGAGLGLSLSREIARAHGGELRLLTCESAKVEFMLTLPAH